MVVCRICKGDHFTLKCPYKDTLGALADVVPSEETDKADQKTAAGNFFFFFWGGGGGGG